MDDIKRAIDDLRTTWEELKHVDAERVEEIGRLGAVSAETAQKTDRLQNQLDELEVRIQKPRHSNGTGEQSRSEATEAWSRFLRAGPRGEGVAEHLVRTDGSGNMLDPRAQMEVSDDTEGGFLAPEEVSDDIIKGIVELSPMRTICTVRSTIRRAVAWPKRTQTAGAVWVGEVETRSETTNPKIGRAEVSTREQSARADISRQDVEDTAFNLEGFVNEEFAEQFGVAEATAFVSGDGVDGKPEGILFAADDGYLGANGIETLASATSDVLAADDLIKLAFKLKAGYVPNATWCLNRQTVRDIRLMKDTGAGNYLWQPGLTGGGGNGFPAVILDRPYVECPDFPVVADAAKVIAFGDFRRGYVIVDRVQIETLRDPYSGASEGLIRLYARKRVGGQTVLPEAIKILKIA